VVSSQSRPADLTLSDVLARGRRFGEHLRARGIGLGDIVAMQLPAWAEWMVACVGIAHAGAVMLPIVVIYGAKELDFILRQSRARPTILPCSSTPQARPRIRRA